MAQMNYSPGVQTRSPRNNTPLKVCPYSCVYCQLGRTSRIQVKQEEFFEPDKLVRAVRDRVKELRNNGERIDYLTFVPAGEPTLDLNLGKEISTLGNLGIPAAVIINAPKAPSLKPCASLSSTIT